MTQEMRTERSHRTLLEKLSLWPRAYKTKILDGWHEIVGRGSTPEASREVALKRLAKEVRSRPERGEGTAPRGP
jgi:hypothetical protein